MEGNKIIKAMRIYLRMTQAEAAKKFGLPLSVYAKYENIPGRIMKGNFLTVYRILVVMQLKSWKRIIQMHGSHILYSILVLMGLIIKKTAHWKLFWMLT